MMLHGPVLAEEEIRAVPRAWPLLVLPPAAIGLTLLAWFRSAGPVAEGAMAPEGFGTAERVAQLLLNQYLLAFELISVVLLVAIIGALSLGKIEKRMPWK